jgi:hypothetical protein
MTLTTKIYCSRQYLRSFIVTLYTKIENRKEDKFKLTFFDIGDILLSRFDRRLNFFVASSFKIYAKLHKIA